MPLAIDLLHLIPEVSAIGQRQLQKYCAQWLKRPLDHAYGIAQLVVDERLMLTVNLHADRVQYVGDRVMIPIDELLGYIIDSHFQDRDERQRLHCAVRESRDRIDDTGHDYTATIGRAGTLYLV
jgi:hypothetical protein